MSYHIIKTTNNRSYWEEFTTNATNFSLQDDLLIFNESTQFSTDIRKFNITTGWLTYYYSNNSQNDIIFEFESISSSSDNSSINSITKSISNTTSNNHLTNTSENLNGSKPVFLYTIWISLGIVMLVLNRIHKRKMK